MLYNYVPVSSGDFSTKIIVYDLTEQNTTNPNQRFLKTYTFYLKRKNSHYSHLKKPSRYCRNRQTPKVYIPELVFLQRKHAFE